MSITATGTSNTMGVKLAIMQSIISQLLHAAVYEWLCIEPFALIYSK